MEFTKLNFAELETIIYKYTCNLAVEIMGQVLAECERNIHKTRDSKRYIANGKRKSNIKVIFGTVPFERHLYIDKVTGENIYLLDQKLKLEKIGMFSQNLVDKVIELLAEMSYRQACDKLELLTNNAISHQGLWNLIQKAGQQIHDDYKVKLKETKNNDENNGGGNIKAPLLFSEHDGLYIKMQHNDRISEKSKSAEMKVGVMYTGWSADKTQRYSKLLNKTAVAGFFDTNDFFKIQNVLAEQAYDMSSVCCRITNADGASWTSNNESTDIFQLDMFHIQQAITKNVRSKEHSKKFRNLLLKQKYDELLYEIKKYKDYLFGKKAQDSYMSVNDLYVYLSNHREHLPRWQEQIKNIPKIPDVQYRNMGVQENQNFLILSSRMKHRRMAWSKAGATNLALILCDRINRQTLNYSAIYPFYINKKCDNVVTEETYSKSIVSAASVNKKYNNKPIKQWLDASVPALNTSSFVGKLLRIVLN